MQVGARGQLGQTLDVRGIRGRVLDDIRAMIVRGDYAPGAALSEVGLAEAFGVSRTPIREALKQLQAEGLVEIKPQVGTFVSNPSLREIADMSRVKEVLEGLAARLMAYRGAVAELHELRRNVVESEAAIEQGRTDRYAELVAEFHRLVLQGADNGKLQVLHRALTNQLAYGRLVRTSLEQPGRPARSVREHRRVLEMIDAKDPDSAEQAMREHVRSSHQELMSALGKTQGGRR